MLLNRCRSIKRSELRRCSRLDRNRSYQALTIFLKNEIKGPLTTAEYGPVLEYSKQPLPNRTRSRNGSLSNISIQILTAVRDQTGQETMVEHFNSSSTSMTKNGLLCPGQIIMLITRMDSSGVGIINVLGFLPHRFKQRRTMIYPVSNYKGFRRNTWVGRQQLQILNRSSTRGMP